MDQEGKAEGRKRIRQLVVTRIPNTELRGVDKTTNAVHMPLVAELAGEIGNYEDWEAVSHTFTLRENGDGILSILFERLS